MEHLTPAEIKRLTLLLMQPPAPLAPWDYTPKRLKALDACDKARERLLKATRAAFAAEDRFDDAYRRKEAA